ncbi:hypothetical protein CFP56_010564 [Quercus suber]|uniref:Uncharacterized protein n=1 Tax=Quercus suber TaxID=58331 RepID=A0AAW0L1K9_QUESU
MCRGREIQPHLMKSEDPPQRKRRRRLCYGSSSEYPFLRRIRCWEVAGLDDLGASNFQDRALQSRFRFSTIDKSEGRHFHSVSASRVFKDRWVSDSLTLLILCYISLYTDRTSNIGNLYSCFATPSLIVQQSRLCCSTTENS